MPLPMAPPSPQIDNTLSTYPAITKQTAGFVDGIPTDVASTQFSDKIMITISQEGRLAQWVPLVSKYRACKVLIPPSDPCIIRAVESQLL